MGLIRKTLSISTAGLISYRNTREKLARAATIKAKADAEAAREQAKLTRAQRQQLDRDER